jgi:hypothetical protein
MRVIIIALFALLLSACEQPELYDTHPEIQTSDRFVVAYFTRNFDIPSSLDSTAIVKATMDSGANCKLLTDVQRYKKHSIVITPKSVFCEEERIKTSIPDGAMSKAYIDAGFFQRYAFGTIRFELYNSDFIGGIEKSIEQSVEKKLK